MNSVTLLLLSLAVLATTTATTTLAFAPCPNSFAGRPSSVCVNDGLPSSMSMKIPFLRKPRFPNIFNRRVAQQEDAPNSGSSVAVLEPPPTSTTTTPSLATTTETEGVKALSTSVASSGAKVVDDECVAEEEELSETQKLMKQVKEAGLAGVISYALWELGFWTVSVPVCVFGYREVTGHWPDFSNKDDMAKLGAEAFAFVNFARFAVPLRIGLALSTTPWIQQNVVDRFMLTKEPTVCDPAEKANGSVAENGLNGDNNH